MKQILFALCLLLPVLAVAEKPEKSNTYPHPASLNSDEVNVRSGPGKRYPILWVFNREGWPVTVLAEYDHWRKIRDLEGEEGWVYKGLLSRQQTAVVSEGDPLPVYRKADAETPILKLEPGVVADLESCNDVMCEVEVNGRKGWALKSRLIQAQ